MLALFETFVCAANVQAQAIGSFVSGLGVALPISTPHATLDQLRTPTLPVAPGASALGQYPTPLQNTIGSTEVLSSGDLQSRSTSQVNSISMLERDEFEPFRGTVSSSVTSFPPSSVQALQESPMRFPAPRFELDKASSTAVRNQLEPGQFTAGAQDVDAISNQIAPAGGSMAKPFEFPQGIQAAESPHTPFLQSSNVTMQAPGSSAPMGASDYASAAEQGILRDLQDSWRADLSDKAEQGMLQDLRDSWRADLHDKAEQGMLQDLRDSWRADLGDKAEQGMLQGLRDSWRADLGDKTEQGLLKDLRESWRVDFDERHGKAVSSIIQGSQLSATGGSSSAEVQQRSYELLQTITEAEKLIGTGTH